MTDSQRSSANKSPVATWMNLWQVPPFWAALGQCTKASEPMARATACANLEMSSLAANRIRAWSAVPATLAKCRTPSDLFQAQVAFWQEAGRHYTETSEQVLAAWQSVVPSVMSAASGERADERDYITLPEGKSDQVNEQRKHPGATRREAA